jgi:RNA polymerase sigma factor (sigma-70 family)
MMRENEPSFAAVARACRGWLRKLARWFGVSADESEDLVQEVLLIGFRKWPMFEGRSKPRTWLAGILVHVLRNHRRKAQRQRRKLDDYVESLSPPDLHHREPVLLAHEIEAALAILNDGVRDVFVRFQMEGHKIGEIAVSLGVNPNTVASRLHAARLALRRHFESRDALLPCWVLWRRESVGAGWFGKGFLGAAVLVLAVMADRPPDEASAEAEHDRLEVSAVETEPPQDPALDVGSSVDHEAEPTELQPEPPAAAEVHRHPTPEPQAPTSDHRGILIERLHDAQRVKSLSAPTCVLVMLGKDSPWIDPRDPSKQAGSGPWMDHVPDPGVLLESICQRFDVPR